MLRYIHEQRQGVGVVGTDFPRANPFDDADPLVIRQNPFATDAGYGIRLVNGGLDAFPDRARANDIVAGEIHFNPLLGHDGARDPKLILGETTDQDAEVVDGQVVAIGQRNVGIVIGFCPPTAVLGRSVDLPTVDQDGYADEFDKSSDLLDDGIDLPVVQRFIEADRDDATLDRLRIGLQVVAERMVDVHAHDIWTSPPLVPAERKQLPPSHAELRPPFVLGFRVGLAEGFEEEFDFLAALKASAVIDDLDLCGLNRDIDFACTRFNGVHHSFKNSLLDGASLLFDDIQQELVVHLEGSGFSH